MRINDVIIGSILWIESALLIGAIIVCALVGEWMYSLISLAVLTPAIFMAAECFRPPETL